MDESVNLNVNQTQFNRPGFPPERVVTFYVLLSVLMRMKKEQGLEAMLEYMAEFITVIDSHNPQLSQALAETLKRIPSGVILYELGKYQKRNI